MQSYDTRFAFQIQPKNPRFSYETHLQDLYRGFHNHHISLDIISENDSLTEYKIVVVPAMYVLTARTAANLERFASEGGIVVFTARTGVKDEFNTVVNLKLPGLVAKMSGIEIEEYVSIPIDQDNRVQFDLADLEESFPTSVWADVVEPKGAQVVAHHTQDFYAGKPAATMHPFGNGRVIYLGVMGDRAYYNTIARWLCGLAGIESLLDAPEGVEVTERWQGEQRILFVLNHTQQPQNVKLDASYTNLLDDKTMSGEVKVAPYGVLMLTLLATQEK